MISVYLRLAFNAIKKNRALYLPYIFATALLGIVYYLFKSLVSDEYVRNIQGSSTTLFVINNGTLVVSFFMVIFVLYLSIFISRKRNMEYGVLSVLGMEKKHLIGLIFVENTILALSAVLISSVGGILLYKFFQAAFLKNLNLPIDNSWHIGFGAILGLVIRYLVIYVLVFLIQAVGILRKKTIDVIKSSSKGEKMRKIDYVLGIVGIAGLVVAYAIALNLPDTFKGNNIFKIINTFASDVILVIVATFLFFAAGSALILSFLKKIKKLYYRKDNFIILSGLSFRMRRNGVGLASVCILFTMVIVSVAGLVSFYSVIDPYIISGGIPHNLILCDRIQLADDDESFDSIPCEEEFQRLKEVTEKHNANMTYTEIDFQLWARARISDSKLIVSIDSDYYEEYEYISTYAYKAQNVSDTDLGLKDNQIGKIRSYELDLENVFHDTEKINSIVLPDGKTYELVDLGDKVDFAPNSYAGNSLVLVFPCDGEEILERMDYEGMLDSRVEASKGEGNRSRDFFDSIYTPFIKKYLIDFDVDYYEQKKIFDEAGIIDPTFIDEDGYEYSVDLYEQQADAMIEFYDVYKGITFVAVAMIAIFVMMSILVLYYKNVFDAYDDLKNFQIMRKVGLDETLVRKCVYLQMIISTLLPIILASLHTLFAEKFIKVLISMFEIKELKSFSYITVNVALVSVVVYIIIGVLLSRTYMNIINRKA